MNASFQPSRLSRRRFVGSAGLVAATLCAGQTRLMGQDGATTAAAKTPWLRKTLKLGMIGQGKTLAEKFAVAKEAGFEGVEPNVPGIDVEEMKAAAQSSGLIIDGTVGGYHWGIRHTDPDESVRAQALEKLKQGILETAGVGADTMLLVPGHGKDGSDAEVHERASAAIRAALPLAQEHGVAILIENVWNDFLYDHEGGADQSADRLAKFIDSFDSPLVGVQFDIGNHWKYGDPAEWIRTLGPRIQKLDIKGFSKADGKFTKVTEGDIDWPSVQKALQEIGFTGWLAAEVGGGDLERLKEVAAHMDEALHCGLSVASAG